MCQPRGVEMVFLAVLVMATGVAATAARRAGGRAWAGIGLGIAFAVAGIAHLVQPTSFEQHLPSRVPATSALVVVTGLVEIALGVALVAARRHAQAVGHATAAYLVAVWPANIYVAIAGVDVDGQPGGAYPWVRVPLQVLFIAWAWWSTARPSREPTSASHLVNGGTRPERGDSDSGSAPREARGGVR
jgi:uncharacterized membrane protein